MKIETNQAKAKVAYHRLTSGLYDKPLRFYNQEEALCHVYSEQGFVSIFSGGDESQFQFGNYQCVQSKPIADDLLGIAISHVKKLGAKRVIGPMHGNTFLPYRFSLTDEKSLPSEIVHKEYYANQWQEFGFRICDKYYAKKSFLKQVSKAENIKLDYLDWEKWQQVSKENLLNDLYLFTHRSFGANWYFKEISFDQFRSIYEPILHMLNTPLSQIVYDGEHIVGLLFAFAHEDFAEEVFVKTVARAPADRYKGIASVMSTRFVNTAHELGFKTHYHLYLHQNNKSRLISEKFGGKVFKEYALFSLKL